MGDRHQPSSRQRLLEDPEAQLKAACGQVHRCTYDRGVFGRQIDRHQYISEDLNHFSVAGHAAAAKVAWDTMRHLGVLPKQRTSS